MRFFISLSIASLVALPHLAMSQTDLSTRMREQGLEAALNYLETEAKPGPNADFAFAGLTFLSAFEQLARETTSYQLPDFGGAFFIAELHSPDQIARSKTLYPDTIPNIISSFEAAMRVVVDRTSNITPEDNVGVTIDLEDIWIDMNGNDIADPIEFAFANVGMGIENTGNGGNKQHQSAVIRFDSADVAWLEAYAHNMLAATNILQSIDIESGVAEVQAMQARLDELSRPIDDWPGFVSRGSFEQALDYARVFQVAIKKQPDEMRTRAARAEFLAMIDANREFWRRLELETDNKAEFIPNARQTSALPMTFPAETNEAWNTILDQAEAVLNGELLVPFWRIGPDGGINLRRLLEDPQGMDILGLFQGQALFPYFERGDVLSLDAFEEFNAMTNGQLGWMALTLN